ncbi:MAG: DUF6270 domain-containing protein, partial [Desulfovibrio sp.]|nr:DUF6270 domain-containing protein [Desulfovibrio sp.]
MACSRCILFSSVASPAALQGRQIEEPVITQWYHMNKLLDFFKKKFHSVKKPTMAIFGDCASHEISKNFTHVSAVGLLNWISINSDNPLFYNSDEIMSDTEFTDYVKRVLVQDINKTALDYLFKEKADYLILDINDCRMDLVHIKNSNIYFTKYGSDKSYLPVLHRI